MSIIPDAFSWEKAILIVEHPDDIAFAQQRLNLSAVTLEGATPEAISGRIPVAISETVEEGLNVLDEIKGKGLGQFAPRFIDIGYGKKLSTSDIAELKAKFSYPKDRLWAHTRFMSEWEGEEDIATFDTTIASLTARWVFPEVAIFCGGYGSGKSTIAQMMALRAAFHHGWKVHICAWEDRRRNLRDRLWRTATGYGLQDNPPPSVDMRAALDLERRVAWSEPTNLDERGLSEYFEYVRYMNKAHGVNVFVCDPWNEFDHQFDQRETETVYVRRMMKEARSVTRELGIIFMLVTHLSKAGYSENGRVKPFRIVNAAGSAEFGNKADHGFAVVRTTSLWWHLNPDNPNLNDEERSNAFSITQECGPPKGHEHVILAVDKAKIEPEMGSRKALAYVLDKQTNNLTYDAAATAVAGELWDVF